jgi:hypothetical protein
MNTKILLHQELEGAIQLKLSDQALKVAKMLLASPAINAEQFESVMVAIGLFERQPRKWRKQIEKAFEALTPGGQKEAGHAIFDYYACMGAFKKAEEFFAARGPFQKPTIMDIFKEFADEEGLEEMAAELEPYLCKSAEDDDEAEKLRKYLKEQYGLDGYWKDGE